MNMNIPGISVSVCSSNERSSIEVVTSDGIKKIPSSHLSGNCDSVVTEFEKVTEDVKGWFGVLYKGRKKKTKDYYTLKKCKIDPEEGVPSSLLLERSLLNKLSHDNIIKCHKVAVGINLESNYIVLDHCLASLNDLLEKKTQIKVLICESSSIKHIIKQLMNGLKFIHEMLVIHRDIHDGNILFTKSGVLKISGFHAARFCSDADMTPCLTDFPKFRAPELLLNSKKYGPPVDMWSAGCVFAKLLLKRPLFEGNSDMETIRSIDTVLGTPTEEIWPGITELLDKTDMKNIFLKDKTQNYLNQLFARQPIPCQKLLKDLLIYFPDARLTAKECLESSYITDEPVACTAEHFSMILKTVLIRESLEKE